MRDSAKIIIENIYKNNNFVGAVIITCNGIGFFTMNFEENSLEARYIFNRDNRELNCMK